MSTLPLVESLNNYYLCAIVVRELFSLLSGPVLVDELTGNTPIFYLGAPVLVGSQEAAGFVSVLRRQRQVDKRQLDVMTPTIND